jgi:hypothetical protein
MPLEPEHPCQGASPDLKLVTQPPTQLPVAFSSFASRAAGDIGDADGVEAVGDVRGETVLLTTARCAGFCGPAACFGAPTTTLGSEVVAPPEGVEVCDIAVPLRPHSSGAIDRIAIAGLATKSDDNFIVMSSQMRGRPVPSENAGYHAPMRIRATAKIKFRHRAGSSGIGARGIPGRAVFCDQDSERATLRFLRNLRISRSSSAKAESLSKRAIGLPCQSWGVRDTLHRPRAFRRFQTPRSRIEQFGDVDAPLVFHIEIGPRLLPALAITMEWLFKRLAAAGALVRAAGTVGWARTTDLLFHRQAL